MLADALTSGDEPNAIHNPYGKNNITKDGGYKYNGIDRVNSELGYELTNCVSCCISCNIAKSDHSYEEFVQLIKRISIYQKWIK